MICSGCNGPLSLFRSRWGRYFGRCRYFRQRATGRHPNWWNSHLAKDARKSGLAKLDGNNACKPRKDNWKQYQCFITWNRCPNWILPKFHVWKWVRNICPSLGNSGHQVVAVSDAEKYNRRCMDFSDHLCFLHMKYHLWVSCFVVTGKLQVLATGSPNKACYSGKTVPPKQFPTLIMIPKQVLPYQRKWRSRWHQNRARPRKQGGDPAGLLKPSYQTGSGPNGILTGIWRTAKVRSPVGYFVTTVLWDGLLNSKIKAGTMRFRTNDPVAGVFRKHTAGF